MVYAGKRDSAFRQQLGIGFIIGPFVAAGSRVRLGPAHSVTHHLHTGTAGDFGNDFERVFRPPGVVVRPGQPALGGVQGKK